MKNSQKIRRMVGLAALASMIVVLQFISNEIQFGPVSITLALIPIVVGAILYGPSGGFVLGLIEGIMVIVAPSTLGLFMPFSAVGTIIVCLLKSGLAGCCSGFIFNWLKKKNFKLAVVLASICVPIVNTGIFAIACLTIFMPLISGFANDANQGMIAYLFLTFIGYNFLIEFFVNSALSPVVIYVVKIFSLQNKIGSNLEFEENIVNEE